MFDHLKNRTPNIIDEDRIRKSSVLIPVVEVDDHYEILFEVRAKNMKKQPGDVCFPGGRIEIGESPLEAAIRETQEELLINDQQIEIIAPMDIFVHHSNLMIYPYLGKILDYKDTYSIDEVDHIFTVPLSYLMTYQPAVYKNNLIVQPDAQFPYNLIANGDSYAWHHGVSEILFYEYNNHAIWGMTAKILESAIRLIGKE